jgi:hypothetical protein
MCASQDLVVARRNPFYDFAPDVSAPDDTARNDIAARIAVRVFSEIRGLVDGDHAIRSRVLSFL